MDSNTKTPTKRQGPRPIRALPAYQVVQRYKRLGYTQVAIARETETSQGTVTNAIHRRGTGPAVERVWSFLEKIL